MTTPTTLEERQAKVKALSEGVRVALVESTETTARYVAHSLPEPCARTPFGCAAGHR